MLAFFEQAVNFIFQEPFLSLLLGGYFFITFGDIKERRLYFDRTYKILIAPTKLNEYSQTPEALNSVQHFFENLFLKTYVGEALRSLSKSTSEYLKINWKKTTGWIFLDIMLLGFLVADLITIEEIAALLGFPIKISFLEAFDYGFAITMGTFFSVITCGFVLFEISANKQTEFSDYSSDFYNPFRTWIKRLSLFTIVSSVSVILFFGLRAFATTFELPDNVSVIIAGLAQLSGNVLVRVNTFVVTLIIFTEALKGLQGVYFILTLIVVVVLASLYLVAETLIRLIRLISDIIYRLFLWIIWTLSFWIAKPLDKITFPFRYLLKRYFGADIGGEPSQETDS